MAVFRRAMWILYEDCSVAGADSGEARLGRRAIAGSPRWRVAGNIAGRVVERAAIFVERRNPVWRSASGAGGSARNLVGAAVGMDFGLAGNDECARYRLQVGRQQARLRC